MLMEHRKYTIKYPSLLVTVTDEAVRFTSGEIALNLDNEYNNALSTNTPCTVLKPFLLFTKTPLNATK